MMRFNNVFKDILSTILVLALLPIGAFGLAGCSSGEQAETASSRGTVAVAVVIGQTNNAPHLTVDTNIRAIFEPVNKNGGYYSIFLASSKPVALGKPIMVPAPTNTKAGALDGRWGDKNGLFRNVYLIDAAVPVAGEVDYLEAIRLAAASLNSAGALACDTRVLYIIGSGLSTSGEYINFTTGIINANYDVLVQDMVASTTAKGGNHAEALPNLSNIHVVWYGMGRLTAEPQMDVPSSYIAQMKELWTTVLFASGATFVSSDDFKDYIPEGGINSVASGYPAVTPVFFTPTDTDDYLIQSMISFDENVLVFVPDSDEYLDPNQAASVVPPYAEALIKSRQTIVVLGTTASGDAASCRALGLQRANRFKQDLVVYGVNPDQIIVVSAGNEGIDVMVGNEFVDFYHEDRNHDTGLQIDEIAHGNRAVHIIPLDQATDVLARFS